MYVRNRRPTLDPLLYGMQQGIAAAHFLAGRYDEASSWAEKLLREHPNHPPALRASAASNVLSGRLADGQKAMARMRQIDPALRVAGLKGLVPFRRPEDLTRYVDALRKAGCQIDRSTTTLLVCRLPLSLLPCASCHTHAE
jgi:hypothetical protein